MYFQNNYNQRPYGQSDSITPQTLHISGNNMGGMHFTIPPPPIPHFISNEAACTFPIGPPPFISKIEDRSTLQNLKTFPALNTLRSKEINPAAKSNLPFGDINVTSVRRDFTRFTALLREFERLLSLLQVFKRTLSEEEWAHRCEEIKSKKEELSVILNKYENPEFFLVAQRAIKKCAKKRVYRKKKKTEWQERKKIGQAFREREHRRIEMWLEKMKDQVEKSYRQEQVKREADLVLSEVTAKKVEAKRFINLFNTLTKLRNARVQQLTHTNSYVSESDSKSFSQVIDKLKKLWVDQLKEYNLEEQGLRVMLNDAEIERVNVEANVTRQILRKWNELIFGEGRIIKNSAEPNNLDELIAIRFEWDHFITADKSCLSSKMPVGWVVPSEPTNSDWSKFLQN